MTTPAHFQFRQPLVTLFALFTAVSLHAAPATDFKFQFGDDQAATGYTLISPTQMYSKDVGYGFEPGANVTNLSHAVTSAQPFPFSVGVPEGNYRVTVTLGDPTADAITTVKAESRRLMLERIHTAAGKSETRTFTVNVRTPKISNGDEVNLDSREMNLATHEAISRDWDDKLTLQFSDSHPAVSAIEIQKVDDAVTVFITGDSTVTDQPGGAITCWGQNITRWFNSDVAIANHAESGETLKGFLKERRWEKLVDSVKAGDYVIIEFGCNDSKKSGPQNIYPNQDFSETYVDANTTYKELLKQFAADVQKKGAFPIIASCSARRQDSKRPGSLQAYADAAIAAAKEIGIPSIDLNSMGVEMNAALGADATKAYNDQTHPSEYGGYLQSKCIALGIKQDNLPLAKFIVDDFPDFDPQHPTPLPAEFNLPPDGGGRGGRGGARRGGAAAVAPAVPAPPADAGAAPKTP
jgi:lysophospholipase L1-like esterase